MQLSTLTKVHPEECRDTQREEIDRSNTITRNCANSDSGGGGGDGGGGGGGAVVPAAASAAAHWRPRIILLARAVRAHRHV